MKTLEQIYVSNNLAIFEQFNYVKSKKNFPHKVQRLHSSVSKRLQIETSLPPRVPFAESMIVGDNPYLWARKVYALETYIDANGIEHLKWMERENIKFGESEKDWGLVERTLQRNTF